MRVKTFRNSKEGRVKETSSVKISRQQYNNWLTGLKTHQLKVGSYNETHHSRWWIYERLQRPTCWWKSEQNTAARAFSLVIKTSFHFDLNDVENYIGFEDVSQNDWKFTRNNLQPSSGKRTHLWPSIRAFPGGWWEIFSAEIPDSLYRACKFTIFPFRTLDLAHQTMHDWLMTMSLTIKWRLYQSGGAYSRHFIGTLLVMDPSPCCGSAQP